ncbi:hypothetical protein EPH_0044070 [Eimeria praecox]|uniref:Uncharacterized protein n=1 Tax=Eimeria praecox TaxID=51316 RepID=U6H565_9EIME|nr:hypothetical protein EPH_0044070 [Eimeria praecox]
MLGGADGAEGCRKVVVAGVGPEECTATARGREMRSSRCVTMGYLLLLHQDVIFGSWVEGASRGDEGTVQNVEVVADGGGVADRAADIGGDIWLIAVPMKGEGMLSGSGVAKGIEWICWVDFALMKFVER